MTNNLLRINDHLGANSRLKTYNRFEGYSPICNFSTYQ